MKYKVTFYENGNLSRLCRFNKGVEVAAFIRSTNIFSGAPSRVQSLLFELLFNAALENLFEGTYNHNYVVGSETEGITDYSIELAVIKDERYPNEPVFYSGLIDKTYSDKYDTLEVQPVRFCWFGEGATAWDVEVADNDKEADFWSLYIHIEGEGVECIADFPTRKSAEDCMALCRQLMKVAARNENPNADWYHEA